MGNATSCAPLIISTTGGVVKVLSSDGGNLQVYSKSVKAGDFMMQNPSRFVCDFNTLKVGQRIAGLLPDEHLQLRHFYLLLPMDLLYSVLTQEEFSSLSCLAAKHANSNNLGRIFPVLSELCMFIPSESKRRIIKVDDFGESDNGADDDKVEEKYLKQGSWRPALETIPESPCRF